MTLTLTTPSALVADLTGDAMTYALASRSERTRRAYRADLDHFTRWAEAHGADTIPASPTVVAAYVADLAETHKAATISRRLAAISVAHQMAGHPSPTADPAVRAVVTGIRRILGTAPDQHAAAGIGEVRRMVARLDLGTVAGLRDRAVLLVGFALAARRSELVALTVANLDRRPEGMTVTIRRSKTDQEGRGTTRALPYGTDPETCPVRALDAWLAAAGITDGPIFRQVNKAARIGGPLGDRSVAAIVKRAAEAAGLDPDRYSGHSLRAGFVTTAAARGASERAIARQTGHAPNSPVLRAYIRHAGAFTDNAATDLGL